MFTRDSQINVQTFILFCSVSVFSELGSPSGRFVELYSDAEHEIVVYYH